MEPIRLWRRNFLRGTQPMWVGEEPKHPAYFQDFVAVRCHEYDALVKERDEAVKDCGRLDRALRDEATKADAATARADKAEALLMEARGWLAALLKVGADKPAVDALRARIDALLEKPNG